MQTEKEREGTDSLHPPEAQWKQEPHSRWAPPDGVGPRGPGSGELAFIYFCGGGENRSALICCKEDAPSSLLGKPN